MTVPQNGVQGRAALYLRGSTARQGETGCKGPAGAPQAGKADWERGRSSCDGGAARGYDPMDYISIALTDPLE